jgi:uncharacterized protein YodC (DUF2158 family)
MKDGGPAITTYTATNDGTPLCYSCSWFNRFLGCAVGGLKTSSAIVWSCDKYASATPKDNPEVNNG